MRLLLVGVPGWNRGDDAIAHAMTRLLREAAPDATIVSCVQRRGVMHGSGARELLARRGAPLAHLRLLFEIARSDLVIIGGGSIIQDRYGAGWVRGIMGLYVEVALLARLFRRPMITAPIGIDPLGTATGRRVARFILSSCNSVFVRDEASAGIAMRLGLLRPYTRPLVATDPALAYAEGRPAANVDAATLVICPALESDTPARLITMFAALISDQLDDDPTLRCRILAMEEREHEDAGRAGLIVAALDPALRTRVTIERPAHVDEAFAILASARAVVTMRLHPMILVSHLVPVFALNRGAKMKAFARDLKLQSLPLDDTDPDRIPALVRGFLAAMDDPEARRGHLADIRAARGQRLQLLGALVECTGYRPAGITPLTQS
ncbi:polysaccharide pyruvyl transferase family protein [Derxia gummosa]|uniref:Polysaccharide pyruvyl transferase family protein n=1 Tax=Derxia gummosa DSM 723 TaxID=1121388 RepID=A0A8B6X446_9BURK|nr:polysaccharide pyruvyl transferase family protein [Derxia gummosa]